MTSVPQLLRFTLLFASLLAATACGSKGPPLAPLRPVPAVVGDVRAARLADTVQLQFTVPTANADRTQPADVARIDVFAVTGEAEGPAGRALTVRELETLATRIASIEVQPPPLVSEDEEEAESPAPEAGPPATPADPRPAQGTVVRVEETLTPALAATVFEHPDAARIAARLLASLGEDAVPEESVPSTEGSGRPLLWMPPPEELSRVYVVVPYSSRNLPGAPSRPYAVPFVPAPPTPPAPRVTHTASAFVLAWDNPAGIRLPVQRTVTDAMVAAESLLKTRPIVTLAPPHTYSVYEVPSAGAPPAVAAAPVNAVPIETPAYEDPRLVFGVPRCYALRTVERRGTLTLESALSPATCHTPVDTFPPLAPTGLTAVGSEGGVSLIWEPNAESDVVGYLVMRGLPGEALRPLMEKPVAETTYRDTTAAAGIMYVYAVVAVDNASPANVSPESNRVQEAAR